MLLFVINFVIYGTILFRVSHAQVHKNVEKKWSTQCVAEFPSKDAPART